MNELFHNLPHTPSFIVAIGNYICKKQIASIPMCISALAVATILRFIDDPHKVMQWVRGKDHEIQRSIGMNF